MSRRKMLILRGSRGTIRRGPRTSLPKGRAGRCYGVQSMGEDATSSRFTSADFKEFQSRLRGETALLGQWFEAGNFSASGPVGGFEIEAWLTDRYCNPAPRNDEFLKKLGNPLVVPELSRFNVEFNSKPERLEGPALGRMQKGLEESWAAAQRVAGEMNLNLLATGILPTVRDEDLTAENMSTAPRYKALNRQFFMLRRGVPVHLKIERRDRLESTHKDVMLEAACTSFQVHLKVPFGEDAAYYNAARIVSAPLVAVAANSPYLFGKDLWDESRIPLFEQGMSVGKWDYCQRVTFGMRYIEESMFEIFHANRQRFPVLMAEVHDDPPEAMRHLRMHNSTIWRWNRPVLDFDSDGTPHLRIENRVMPAGPSIIDQMANAAFYYGLMRYLAPRFEDYRWEIPFADARDNFYRAAKEGLGARVTWLAGKQGPIRLLVLDVLLGQAREGLIDLGLDGADIELYLGIIEARAETGRNGAEWQRAYVEGRGADMKALCGAYREQQASGEPVHRWPT